MIEHIAMMIGLDEKWVDVFYNAETKECYQDFKANKHQEKTKDGNVLISVFDEKWDAMCYLENEFGSNVELD